MREINGLPLHQIDSANERRWFSYMKEVFKEAPFGKVDLTFTIKDGKVTNIKSRTERSFSIHNMK